MPVSAKPKAPQESSNSVDVEALIRRGGSVAQEENGAEEKPRNVQLRLLPSKLQEIDALLAQRRVKISRHLWFMEAIEEKLERESRGERPRL